MIDENMACEQARSAALHLHEHVKMNPKIERIVISRILHTIDRTSHNAEQLIVMRIHA